MLDRAIGELIASGAIGAKDSPVNDDCDTGELTGALNDSLSMLSSAQGPYCGAFMSAISDALN